LFDLQKTLEAQIYELEHKNQAVDAVRKQLEEQRQSLDARDAKVAAQAGRHAVSVRSGSACLDTGLAGQLLSTIQAILQGVVGGC
jgi:hypothetical protein